MQMHDWSKMTKAQEVLEELKREYPDMPYGDGSELGEVLWGQWSHTPSEEDDESHGSRRWYEGMTTYWGFDDGSWLAIDWDSGLTENQDSAGPFDIYLVEQYEEIVVTKKYRKVK